MKIAFFSDVHANLPALEAFFSDLEKVKPDMIYCLGDLVGYNVWANEVVDEIRKRGIPTIMGNHEAFLIRPAEKNDQSNKGITSQLITPENRKYLISLPRHLKLSFEWNDESMQFFLVHGSPKAIDDYLVEDYPEDQVIAMMNEHQADIILWGHTHIPYHRTINAQGQYFHVINLGSIGKPKDGDPRLCYALLTIEDDFSLAKRESLTVEFRRVTYDVHQAMKAIQNSAFPNDFAEALRIAR